jgi:hypothetical protein
MITMFAGDPKLGKSFVTLAMAAAVSRGLGLPQSDLPNQPASCILMSAEDDPARTIVPRLMAAGADRSRIHLVDSVKLANGSETLPSLPAHIDAIRAAAEDLGDCRLIVIDPVPAYLSGIDDYRNSVLRGALTPLKILAERLSVAVVLVSHLTKGGSAHGKHRVLGSIGYVGACRANFLFLPDRKDRARRRVLMVDIGGNVAPLAPPLAYTIESQDGQGPLIVWADEPVTAARAAAQRGRPETNGQTDRAKLSDAVQWLRETLGAGRVSAAELRYGCMTAGFSWATLYRAKAHVGAVTRREGFGAGAKTYWQLRDTTEDGST